MMKGSAIGVSDRLLLKMDKRFSWTSDSDESGRQTAAARQHAPPYLNDWRRTWTGRKGDGGNTADKGKGVFLS